VVQKIADRYGRLRGNGEGGSGQVTGLQGGERELGEWRGIGVGKKEREGKGTGGLRELRGVGRYGGRTYGIRRRVQGVGDGK